MLEPDPSLDGFEGCTGLVMFTRCSTSGAAGILFEDQTKADVKAALFVICGALILLLGSIALVAGVVQRRRIRTVYDKRIGLDLPGLVELLPDELKQRRYTRFMLSPRMNEHLSVGLVYGSTNSTLPTISLRLDVGHIAGWGPRVSH